MHNFHFYFCPVDLIVYFELRQAGQVELAERLVECQYELTDRLAFYLCGRRPGEVLHS